MRLPALAVMFAIGLSSAHAEPPAVSDLAKLGGEWRASREGVGKACGADSQETDLSLVMEFAMTGGQLSYDDGTEASGSRRVLSASREGQRLALNLDGKESWIFNWTEPNVLRSEQAPGSWADAGNAVFHHCRETADRSAIHLDKTQLASISADMPPDNVVFVNARAKGGCKATEFQYVFFDLVGPLAFKAGRWNSTRLAEKLAEGGKPATPTDEITNWIIERAEQVGADYRLTLTELIPPNGSRGDTSTITLSLEGDRAQIKEWKRSYIRCSRDGLAYP